MKRRRSFESRTRLLTRRKHYPTLTLCCLTILTLFLILVFWFVLPPNRPYSSFKPSILERNNWAKPLLESLNVTEEMLSPYSLARQMNDQISIAKGLVETAKETSDVVFGMDLTSQISNLQVILSDAAIKDDDTQSTLAQSKAAIQNMAFLLNEAKKLEYDPATTIMKLQDKIENLEQETRSINEKSSKYGQIAAEAIPRNLYCLGVRLTLEWFSNPKFMKKQSAVNSEVAGKLVDNNLLHFCIFSDNILATSVVINSTALSSKNPNLIVFHIVSDEVNYAPMSAWFRMNDFHGVTVDVQKFEDFKWLNASYVPVLKQLQDSDTQIYYFSGSKDDGKTPIKYRNPKYLSMLNHLRFYIPEVFPKLEKVVFLDDDVVVHKDLSPLFTTDLNGNVIGAVETCMERFHRYHKYLNFSHPLIRTHFDPDACGWAFGMNVFDLVEWRKRNVTGIYHYWQEKNIDRTLWKLGTLPPGLLTFYGLTEPLDPNWHVLGFGYTNVDPHLVEKGAVLHFNGNSKPWLKIGKQKYKPLWEKYVDYSHPMLQECNVY